ncbi:MAG: phytanoyl-CoA dioxygenase family protein, partial [Cyanobacteria bacterium P01_A01_bin.3]
MNVLEHNELKQDFQTQGFVVLERAIAPEQVVALRAAIARLAQTIDVEQECGVFRTSHENRDMDERFFASAREVRGFLEDGALDSNGKLQVPRHACLNKLGHALHDFVPEIGELARSREVVDAFRAVGLQQAHLVQSMAIFKQPRIGGAVPWHQDATYLLTRPSSVVGLWLALEDADRDNGCLWVAPGAQRSPLRELYEVDWSTRTATTRTLDSTPWPNEAESVPLEVPAGSLVLFHDRLPHCSYANRSDRSR